MLAVQLTLFTPQSKQCVYITSLPIRWEEQV